MERVNNTGVLPVAQSGLRPPEEFAAVPIQLIKLAGTVAAVNVFGGHLKAPRRTDTGNGFLEVQIRVVDLDAIVATIGNVDEVLLGIDGDAMHRVELILAGTASSNGFDPGPVLCDLNDARVVVAVGDEDIVLSIPGDVGLPVECSHGSGRKSFGIFFAPFDEAFEE